MNNDKLFVYYGVSIVSMWLLQSAVGRALRADAPRGEDQEQHVIKKSYVVQKIIGFLTETRYMP